MANPQKSKENWREINKIRKEKRKQRREQVVEKAVKKLKLSTESTDAKCNKTYKELDSKLISTISIAVPGSILENSQSPELRTYLAGQIARAACIFQIDEIVVFDDYGSEGNYESSTLQNETGVISARKSCIQLCRILQYLECPQYLRKHLFPIHHDLKYCGILNPLQAPHHLGPNDKFTYREGVVLNKPVKKNKGSYVNVGLLKEVCVDKVLTPGLRCTVELLPEKESKKNLEGIVVSPSVPRLTSSTYWGYTVRIASSISKVISQCPFKEGYDLIIGTSDKGDSIYDFECPSYTHALIVFGGLQGLEAAVENDNILNIDNPTMLFDFYLNALPDQGSKTIRTEEAILITLSALRNKIFKNK